MLERSINQDQNYKGGFLNKPWAYFQKKVGVMPTFYAICSNIDLTTKN